MLPTSVNLQNDSEWRQAPAATAMIAASATVFVFLFFARGTPTLDAMRNRFYRPTQHCDKNDSKKTVVRYSRQRTHRRPQTAEKYLFSSGWSSFVFVLCLADFRSCSCVCVCVFDATQKTQRNHNDEQIEKNNIKRRRIRSQR